MSDKDDEDEDDLYEDEIYEKLLYIPSFSDDEIDLELHPSTYTSLPAGVVVNGVPIKSSFSVKWRVPKDDYEEAKEPADPLKEAKLQLYQEFKVEDGVWDIL